MFELMLVIFVIQLGALYVYSKRYPITYDVLIVIALAVVILPFGVWLSLVEILEFLSYCNSRILKLKKPVVQTS